MRVNFPVVNCQTVLSFSCCDVTDVKKAVRAAKDILQFVEKNGSGQWKPAEFNPKHGFFILNTRTGQHSESITASHHGKEMSRGIYKKTMNWINQQISMAFV